MRRTIYGGGAKPASGGGGGGSTKYGLSGADVMGDVNGSGVLQLAAEGTVDLVFKGVIDLADDALRSVFTANRILKSVSFPDLTQISGAYALYESFYGRAYNSQSYKKMTAISFPELVSVTGTSAMYNTFGYNYGLTSVSFPKLTTISGYSAMNSAFGYCDVTSFNFPELTTISGQQAMRNIFIQNGNLTSGTFPKLATLASSSQALYYAFAYCSKLTSLSFPALKSDSFGSYTDQFNSMLQNVTGCTVHFPSNLQSVIGSWASVTGGFGGTNTTVLFDLPATEEEEE